MINVITKPSAEITNQETIATHDFNEWNCDLLSDHIVQTHHQYAIGAISEIRPMVDKVVATEGANYPELKLIKDFFLQLSNELLLHMRKEELVLFPGIKKLVSAEASGLPIDTEGFRSVKFPVSVMEMEHETASMIQQKLFGLSNGYTPSEGASKALHELYGKLKEFDDDLHRHVYVENKVLFPKAILLEQNLMVN